MADPKGADKLTAGQVATAKVTLADGRTQSLKVTVTGPSPSVTLIAKSVQPAESADPIAIRLTGPDELRQGAVISFSLRAHQPARFSGDETIEVAAGRRLPARLTEQSGLTLEDAQVAVATLDTAKAFNGSAFGPLRYRVVTDDGGRRLAAAGYAGSASDPVAT